MSNSSICKDSEKLRLKIKCTESSNQKVNEDTNKAPRIKGIIVYEHIYSSMKPCLEKHFLELQHTDKFSKSPLGLIIMHIHQCLFTHMLFYF